MILLLVSTGAAEVLLMLLGALALLPPALTAVQLLWLNLITNGMQDVALAFEQGEPGGAAPPGAAPAAVAARAPVGRRDGLALVAPWTLGVMEIYKWARRRSAAVRA